MNIKKSHWISTNHNEYPLWIHGHALRRYKKTLQTIVNDTRVPLPFRRYNWIPRDCKLHQFLGYHHRSSIYKWIFHYKPSIFGIKSTTNVLFLCSVFHSYVSLPEGINKSTTNPTENFHQATLLGDTNGQAADVVVADTTTLHLTDTHLVVPARQGLAMARFEGMGHISVYNIIYIYMYIYIYVLHVYIYICITYIYMYNGIYDILTYKYNI